MPRACWVLHVDQPVIEIELPLARGGKSISRRLLADTGAGTNTTGFELLIDEQDCLLCGGNPLQPIVLGGAYRGSYPIFLVQVRIPSLGFDRFIPVVGVTGTPRGCDGMAGFRFLNRFHYGNFGNPKQFGLEI